MPILILKTVNLVLVWLKEMGGEEMSGKGREGEKMRVNLNFIVWFDVESSLIPFISCPFPLLSFPSISPNQTCRQSLGADLIVQIQ